MPNERWQADITHWRLADGTEVEILNVIDDHSRLLVASDARHGVQGRRRRGELPREPLRPMGSRHRCSPTTARCSPRRLATGRCAIELETAALGISLRHSRPYHPQTCGKVERFHQTLKRWLAKQPPAATLDELQAPARPVPRLLQHRAPAPGARAAHARRGLRAPGRRRRPRCRDCDVPAHYRVRRDRSTSAGPSRFATTAGCTTSVSGDGSSAPG